MGNDFQTKTDAQLRTLVKMIGTEAAHKVYNKICASAYTHSGDRAEFILSRLGEVVTNKSWNEFNVKLPLPQYIFCSILGFTKKGLLQHEFSVKDINRLSSLFLMKETDFLIVYSKGNDKKKAEYFIAQENGKFIINPEFADWPTNE